MEKTTEIIRIQSIDKFPPIDYIKNIPRNKELKIIFDQSIQHIIKSISDSLRNELSTFLINTHNTESTISIVKLITEEEIKDNHLFFENCAKDYRKLAEELFFKFVQKKKIKYNPKFPFLMFNKLKGSRKTQSGKIDDWKYFIHGFHCYFENVKTKQNIEVPFMFGMEFGDLDPYFFVRFIKSTPKYQPLPIIIYDDFSDGNKINQVMLSLGLFERINSNLENLSGIVVTDRNKITIDIFDLHQDQEKARFKNLYLGFKNFFK